MEQSTDVDADRFRELAGRVIEEARARPEMGRLVLELEAHGASLVGLAERQCTAMRVRPVAPDDLEACQTIVRGLPDFFTEDVPDKIASDLDAHHGWVITKDDGVVAFAVVEYRSSRAAEILWIAVRRDQRNQGVGATLLEHVLDALAADDIALIQAKTLDASADYEPYIATRTFWEHHGFVRIDTIDPLPGWQPGNPAAIQVCALTSTR
ncbi:MAG TPA: GNAT family N-acetyltransferase [Solirubrobacterales bacterium]